MYLNWFDGSKFVLDSREVDLISFLFDLKANYRWDVYGFNKFFFDKGYDVLSKKLLS